MSFRTLRWILWSAVTVLFMLLGTVTGLIVLQGSSQPTSTAALSSGVADVGGEPEFADKHARANKARR